MSGTKEFKLSPESTKPVDDMVAAQNKIAINMGVPQYGYPSVLLYDIPSICKAARKKAEQIAKQAGQTEFSWQLHYKLNGGVYGEISW